VGKSSIFNKILETERAIVTSIPGTTRDFLEEALALDGFLIKLYDTAGIRSTEDEIEKIGIKRSFDLVRDAHLVVYVNDGGNEEDLAELEALVGKDKILKLLNKSDLHSEALKKQYLERDYLICSTEEDYGLQAFKQSLLAKININPAEMPETLLSNSRQIAAVQKALENIRQARIAVSDMISVEFIAFDLQEASRNLEDITGIITTDDMLDKIFSEFCIGK
jgi:tRNA modification GTPase